VQKPQKPQKYIEINFDASHKVQVKYKDERSSLFVQWFR